MKVLGSALVALGALAWMTGSCVANDARPAGGSLDDERTLVQVERYIVELTSLKRELLTRANVEEVVNGRLLPRGNHYEQDFTVDEGFGINLTFEEQSDRALEIEFRPRLSLSSVVDQKSFEDYRKRLQEYAPMALKQHCIAQADIVKSLLESGWKWFPTELSSSPDDHDGNILYASPDKGFLVVTVENSCLAGIDLTTEKSYLGHYGKAIGADPVR